MHNPGLKNSKEKNASTYPYTKTFMYYFPPPKKWFLSLIKVHTRSKILHSFGLMCSFPKWMKKEYQVLVCVFPNFFCISAICCSSLEKNMLLSSSKVAKTFDKSAHLVYKYSLWTAPSKAPLKISKSFQVIFYLQKDPVLFYLPFAVQCQCPYGVFSCLIFSIANPISIEN